MTKRCSQTAIGVQQPQFRVSFFGTNIRSISTLVRQVILAYDISLSQPFLTTLKRGRHFWSLCLWFRGLRWLLWSMPYRTVRFQCFQIVVDRTNRELSLIHHPLIPPRVFVVWEVFRVTKNNRVVARLWLITSAKRKRRVIFLLSKVRTT